MNAETIERIRRQAERDGDAIIVRACGRAVLGDFAALATLEETLEVERKMNGSSGESSRATGSVTAPRVGQHLLG